MRRTLSTVAAFVLVVSACSAEADGETADDGPAVTEPDTTDGPDGPDGPPATDADAPATGEDPEPFESEPVTPVQPGTDIDDVLRDEQAPAPTTAPAPSPTVTSGDAAPPPPEPLEPGPLPWTLRRATEPADTTVDLLVVEVDCDGARPIAERVVVAVRESDDRVEIGTARAIAAPSQRTPCPTAPFTPIPIVLDQPIGERQVIPIDVSAAGRPLLPVDDVGPQVALRVSVPGAATASATSTTVSDAGFGIVLECSVAGGTAGRDWRPTTEFASTDLVLTAGADALRWTGATWHEFVVDTGEDRGPHHIWVAASGGAPLGWIEARRGTAGWVGAGAICPQTGTDAAAADFDAVVDASIGLGPDGAEPVQPAPIIDVASLIEWTGVPPEMEFTDGELRFLDVDRRCAGWNAIEDDLLAAGFTLGPERTVVDTAGLAVSPASANPAMRQRLLVRRIDGPDGRSALLRTSADGRITTTPVAMRSTGTPSRLQPCRLDGPTSVIPIVVS